MWHKKGHMYVHTMWKMCAVSWMSVTRNKAHPKTLNKLNDGRIKYSNYYYVKIFTKSSFKI